MSTEKAQLEALTEIRTLMDRSSRFLSLSGLSGIISGVFALAGVGAAYLYFDESITSAGFYANAYETDGQRGLSFTNFMMVDAGSILVLSFIAVIALTLRQAKRNRQAYWDSTAKRLAINMLIPLVTGGLFCLALIHHGLIPLVAPATLIFYGLAMLNASKYTIHDIRYLGLCEIILGLIATMFPYYGLLFWAAGFGVLHLIYGTVMYKKYEA
jgi:hypothetical protein